MYNLTVDGAHTFFVGDGQWLVHNCDFYDFPPAIHKDLKYWFERYPSDSFGCQQCASGISSVLKFDLPSDYFRSIDVITINRTHGDFIADANGRIISESGIHQVVKVELNDGRTFYIDSLVYEIYGFKAVDRQSYLNLFGDDANMQLDFPPD